MARLPVLFLSFSSLLFAQSAASFRGLVVTSSGTVWASGTNATVLRGGAEHFQTCAKPPHSDGLDFRGLYASNSGHAIVMSAGTGPLSRLYETTDGCLTWRLLFSNPDPQGFWDTLTFNPANPDQGALLGDPVNGRFTLFRTSDRGQHWTRDLNPGLASNPVGEGAFAASNSSLVFIDKSGDLLFGTGGLGGPRIFRFDAQSKTWTTLLLPVALPNETTGIFSIACHDGTQCWAVGGDYKRPNNREGTAFFTTDGGRTWIVPSSLPRGYRSAVSWSPAGWLVAGPTGAESSSDNGSHWTALSEKSWNVLCQGWAAGPKGLLAPLLGATN